MERCSKRPLRAAPAIHRPRVPHSVTGYITHSGPCFTSMNAPASHDLLFARSLPVPESGSVWWACSNPQRALIGLVGLMLHVQQGFRPSQSSQSVSAPWDPAIWRGIPQQVCPSNSIAAEVHLSHWQGGSGFVMVTAASRFSQQENLTSGVANEKPRYPRSKL